MELTKNQQQILDLVKEMNAVELNGLVKALEEEFGVTAAAMVVAGGAAAGAGAADAGASDAMNVELTDAGQQKIAVIKVVKEVLGLDLKAAKELVEKAPVGDRFDLRGRFNANLGGVMNLPEQLDVYPGLSLSLKNFGGHIGARYFFNKGFGVFSEITFPIARYKTSAAGYERLNNQFTFQIGAAFDLN